MKQTKIKKTKKWTLNKKDFDFSVDPRNDFFNFVNGGWLKKNKIPSTETVWGTFYVLRKKNKKILHNLLQGLMRNKKTKNDHEIELVRKFYSSGMNTKKRNKDGVKDLEEYLKKIDFINSIEELPQLIGELHMIGAGCFWNAFAEQNLTKSEDMMLWLYQGGLGLPEKDYYTPKSAKEKKIFEEYRKHIENIFTLAGSSPNLSKMDAQRVLVVESCLAKHSMNKEERYDYHKQNNKRTYRVLKRAYPKVNWPLYFKALGVKNITTLNVAQPSFFSEVNRLFSSVPLSDIKAYLRWSVFNNFAEVLSDNFIQEDFNFYGVILSGQKKIKPRWERILGIIEGSLGEALGKLYAESYFRKTAKKKMDVLVDDLMDVYKARIKENSWMGNKTKLMALKKLSTVKRKIGYPSKWKGYKGLALTKDSYVKNICALSTFHYKRNLKKIGKKVDRSLWHFSPATVNACYDPGLNDITFPAGILQPPFFDEYAPDAINYGAIGSVIGHELTHGFDNNGSTLDAYGNLKNWWTKKDKAEFNRRGNILVKQFNRAVLFDGLHVNGTLTLGENIADLGGIVLAYEAYKKFKKRNNIKDFTKQGFTDEQLFFIGYAITERSHSRKERARQMLIVDPHSPSQFRVNIILSNIVPFHQSFGVTSRHRLFKKEGERAEIW